MILSQKFNLFTLMGNINEDLLKYSSNLTYNSEEGLGILGCY